MLDEDGYLYQIGDTVKFINHEKKGRRGISGIIAHRNMCGSDCGTKVFVYYSFKDMAYEYVQFQEEYLFTSRVLLIEKIIKKSDF